MGHRWETHAHVTANSGDSWRQNLIALSYKRQDFGDLLPPPECRPLTHLWVYEHNKQGLPLLSCQQYYSPTTKPLRVLGYPEHNTDLSQSLSVGAHVGEDDQHVFLTLVGKELGRCQGQTGRDDTLNTVSVCVCVWWYAQYCVCGCVMIRSILWVCVRVHAGMCVCACDDTLNTVGVCACGCVWWPAQYRSKTEGVLIEIDLNTNKNVD